MAAVSVMHEEMHQRASQQRKPHERTEQISAMFHPRISTADRQKADQHQPRRELPQVCVEPDL